MGMKIRTGAAALCLTVGAVGFAGVAGSAAAPAEKTTICHATGTPDDAGNGYVVIRPSNAGVFNGHVHWEGEDGAVIQEGHEADIIPPFTYKHKGQEMSFPGQNWDAKGQDIYNGGTCDGDGVVDEPEPTDPEPTTPEPTTPEPTTPEPTSPEPTSPEPTSPEPTSPEPTSPEPTSPEPTSPEPTSPEPTSPEPTSPEPTSPEPTSPEPTSPEPTSPEPTSPEPTSPEPTTPGETPAPPPGNGPETPGTVQTDGGPMGGASTLLPYAALAGGLALAGAGLRRTFAYDRKH